MAKTVFVPTIIILALVSVAVPLSAHHSWPVSYDKLVTVKGTVTEWSPPRRLSVTWTVDWIPQMRSLPECLITYDIELAGQSVKLTMTEAHQWDVPEDLLSGGRAGWPAILSSLKSVLETGKPLLIEMQPPKEMLAALQRLSGDEERAKTQ